MNKKKMKKLIAQGWTPPQICNNNFYCNGNPTPDFLQAYNMCRNIDRDREKTYRERVKYGMGFR